MAIELQVPIENDITVSELRDGLPRIIRELTGNQSPELLLWRLIDTQKQLVADESPIVGEGIIIVELETFEAQVVLNIAPSYEDPRKFVCAVSAEYSRTAVEVTLAACCAIWLARRGNVSIQDDWNFWTTFVSISADTLAERIGVRGVNGLEAACQRLVGERISSC